MKRLIAAAAVAIVALTGCVAIPSSGPVTQARADDDEPTSDLVFLAQEPAVGASQQDVVQGFLAAAVSPSGDFAIARQYLTKRASNAWDPAAQVVVRSVPPEVSLAGDGSATAVVTAVSVVDRTGLASLAEGAERTLEFQLQRVDGEWRISGLPAGIVLSSYHFAQLFRAYPLFWRSFDGTRAVADTHWFERTDRTLAARIVDAQLRPPPEWLAPGVQTAASEGVARVGEPRLQDGIASIEISARQVEQAGLPSLAPLAQQLQLALQPLGVQEVRLTVDGLAEFETSSLDAGDLALPGVDARPLVLEGSTLRAVGAGEQPFAELGEPLAALGATNLTIGDQGGVALAGSDAVWVRSQSEPTVITEDAAAAGTTDDYGWALVPERTSPGTLLAWRDGERIVLPLAGARDSIVALELAPDGSRLAVVEVDDGVTRAWVAAIERGPDARPERIGEPFPLSTIEGEGLDVAWTSPTSLAVLARNDAGTQVEQITIGGDSQLLPQPQGPLRSIDGGIDGSPTLRALTEGGSLVALRGRVWSEVDDVGGVSLLATQQ